ncbi:CNNM domain-containing protein [Teredinibacter franksiae]|uniref:CNNM domain-containing protein n=1 Tax=Teredinibacter franksiae TaxID=2761453 RepID=UPI00162820D0|nr:CNNM domain-containing protein [Teredinibacter franksiae]
MTLLFIYLTIAIGVSFLCSILEAVLLSITPGFVQNVSSKSPGSGKVLVRVKERLDESISSILILNTFAHTMGAAGVGSQAAQVFGAKWETLIAVLLTLVILYFSEIIPKTLGATFWRQLATPSAHVIVWLVKLVYPLVWLSGLITRLFSNNAESNVSRDEIIALASLGHKLGSLGRNENRYLANALGLGEIKTQQIATPQSVVHSLSAVTTVKNALDNEKTRQFSRIPIYDESGTCEHMVLNRDLYEAERQGQGDLPIKEFSKAIRRVSEDLTVQQLLQRFLSHREHIFIVEDSYGQDEGVVSLEDAIETLLGTEIVDESDTVEDLQEFVKDKYRNRVGTEKS